MHTRFDAQLPKLTWQHRWGWGFLWVNHAPTPREAGVPSAVHFWVSFYLCVHHSSQNYQISLSNTQGDGLVFRGSATPYASALQISGFPSIYGYTVCRRNTKFDVVHMWGFVLGVSPAPPKGGAPALHNLETEAGKWPLQVTV